MTQTSGSTTDDPSDTTGVDSLDTSGDGSTGEPPELTREEQVLQDLSVAMYACPELVWPGNAPDNYRSRQFLLVSVAQDQAWLWNDQVAEDGEPPRVSTGPASSLPLEWTASTFNFGVLNGVRTVSISLDETDALNDPKLGLYQDYASILAFHEGFHFLSDQDDWNVLNGSRTSPYPEPWEPRYLRAELIRALQLALEEDAPLGRAMYWQVRTATEYPGNHGQFRPLEVLEGSAEYATIVASVVSQLGCDVTEDELLTEAVANLEAGFLNNGYSAGGEPYDIGMLSGLLLRRARSAGWEDRVEDGEPPVEVLLEGVEATAQRDDAELQAAVQEVVEARNTAVGMEIDPMLEALDSPDFVRVVGSMAWISGSFQLSGFYYLPDVVGEPEVFVNLSTVLDPPSGVVLSLDNETSLVGSSTPCAIGGSNSIVLTLPVEDVAWADGVATSTADTVTFDGLAVEETTDEDGLTWLCPVDGGGASPWPGGPVEDSPRPVPSSVERGADGRLNVRL